MEKGIQTTVITGHNESAYRNENVEGIDVHYLPVTYKNSFGFTARSSAFLKYIIHVINKNSIIRDADVCYAISVPLTVGLAALWIKFRYKIPFIFEVGDLWPEAPIQMGVIKNPLLKGLLFSLEKTIYQHALSVVALSPAIQQAIQKKTPGKMVHLIPNMADVDFYKPGEKNTTLETKFNVSGKFVVSYVGALGVANGLDYFLECARASQKLEMPIHFLLCGDGAMKKNLEQSALRLQLQNLSFLDFQNRSGVSEVMNVTDAVFISYKSVPVLETGSPNKYFDGLAAGKMIVINFSGWIKEEIEKQECGIYLDSKHPTDFVKKITPFLSDATRHKYQAKARELAIQKYSRKTLGEKFVAIVQAQ